MSCHSLRSIDIMDNKPSDVPPETNFQQKNDDSSIKRLEFENFVDVQSRLVLLPRIEEEAKGAVISSFTPPPPKIDAQENAEPSSEDNRDDQETISEVAGFILVGLEGLENDFMDTEFSDILATIRQQEQEEPIVLIFKAPPGKNTTENNNPENVQSSLLSWGQRMRKQAAGAADRYALAADRAAAAVATAAKERIEKAKQSNLSPLEKPCDVFLQTSVGAFIPVSSLREQKVSTSSLLLVRKSATENFYSSGKGYSFQWYRSSKLAIDDDETSISGRTQDSGSVEWIPLPGATLPSFQPNTTLVGRRLKCEITLPEEAAFSDDDSFQDSITSSQQYVIPVELSHPVIADLALFNGTRQALLRGAKFSNFKGRGNASNQTFAVEVEIGVGKQGRRQVPMSSVSITMSSGEEIIALTEEPLKQLSAEVDASNSKFVNLVFPEWNCPEDGSMLSAMCTNGRLELEASNRMARESLLVALGLANYQGKPGNLGCKTILYRNSSPARSLFDDDSISSSSASSRVSSPEKSIASSSPQSPSIPECVSGEEENNDTVAALHQELDFLRGKLARKDKVVSQLQRQIAKSDEVYQQTRQAFQSAQQDLNQSRVENQQLSQKLTSADKKVQSQEASMVQLKLEHASNVSFLNKTVSKQSGKIAEVEKANKVLQNEKALLSAAVEARESKLVKMKELQSSVNEMSKEIAKQEELKLEITESQKRADAIQQDFEMVQSSEQQCRSDLKDALNKVDAMRTQVKQKQEYATSCQAQLDPLQKQNQKLKAERNNFKQKNDSLSKEISRICRDGRTVHEIERVMANHQALSEEVELLRKQKRKALEDAHEYRNNYEKAKAVQQMAGLDNETRAALERNAEMERLLAEMTEYVNAKEMQLDTLKQVNEHLQEEIHSLAQANLKKDEV